MTPPPIGVALKLTPRRLDVDPLTGEVTPDRAPGGASAAGLAALEIALRLREAWATELTVAAVGPAAADAMLRDALAMGADHAVRVPADHRNGGPPPDHSHGGPPPDHSHGGPPADRCHSGPSGLPSAVDATARALAAALAHCPVVLCGDGGSDGTGAVPALLAAHGGRAQALGLTRAEAGEPGVVHAERRLDRGWRERLLVRAPMVISVESAAARPRRAALARVLAARDCHVAVLGAAAGTGQDGAFGGGTGAQPLVVTPYRPRARVLAAPAGDSPLARVLSLVGTRTDHKKAPRCVEAEPAEAAREIVDQLRRWGYL